MDPIATIDEIDSLKLTRWLSDMVANDDDALQRSNLISIASIDELQIRLDQPKILLFSPARKAPNLARNLQTILGFKWHPSFSLENEHELHLPYLVTVEKYRYASAC